MGWGNERNDFAKHALIWLLLLVLGTASASERSKVCKLLPLSGQSLGDGHSGVSDGFHHLLSTSQPFVFADMGLSKSELDILDNLKVGKIDSYDRFGEIDLLATELPIFLRSHLGMGSDLTINTITAIVLRVAKDVIRAQNKDTAWVTIRSSKKNDFFKLPRWHTDGRFFSTLRKQAKFAAVLKGPGTLFCGVTPEVRKQFIAIENDRNLEEMEARKRLARLLKRIGPQQPSRGQGAWFIVGDDDMAAVHSEPPIEEDRLFFSVVAGTNDEIRELATEWGQP